MKLHPTVLVVATAAVVTGLTGCGVVGAKAEPTSSTVAAGLGSPEQAEEGTAPVAEASAGTTTTSTTSKKKPKHPSTPATSHTPKPHGPRVVTFKVVQKPKCEEGTAVFRAKAVPLIIKWKVTGADSAALSVDDLTPGSYGPVELTGTQEFTFSCSGAVGETETHTYGIYTVGGGAQQHKTLKVSAKVLDKGLGTN
jgi:hypothetical protein